MILVFDYKHSVECRSIDGGQGQSEEGLSIPLTLLIRIRGQARETDRLPAHFLKLGQGVDGRLGELVIGQSQMICQDQRTARAQTAERNLLSVVITAINWLQPTSAGTRFYSVGGLRDHLGQGLCRTIWPGHPQIRQ